VPADQPRHLVAQQPPAQAHDRVGGVNTGRADLRALEHGMAAPGAVGVIDPTKDRLAVGAARLLEQPVDDDGRGFDPTRPGAGHGLRNLREHAAALGGRAEITSAPGEGARVRVTIPR